MYLLIGTAKGLFRYHSIDRQQWTSLGPVLLGDEVYTSAYDPKTKRLYAAANSIFYGPSIRRSADWGATWDTGGSGLSYGADDNETVSRVWSIQVGQNGMMFAGVEASGLFQSLDSGDTWAEVSALRQHPTHDTWGPGFGGKCLHSIAIDPFDDRRLFIACSSGGIYRSPDRGTHWQPINRSIRAEFNPEGQQYPPSGQCVHKFWVSPSQPGRLWLQNHGGVYRSDDGGDDWIDVGGPLPSDFGFGIVGHVTHPDWAYVVPVERGPRWPYQNQLAVWQTKDAGRSWEPLSEGLPTSVYSGVLRDALTSDSLAPQGLYFGTTSGDVFCSADEGQHWTSVAHHLPRIFSVVFVDEP